MLVSLTAVACPSPAGARGLEAICPPPHESLIARGAAARRSALLQSPNHQLLAWTLVYSHEGEIRSQLWLRDHALGRETIAARTRSGPAGVIPLNDRSAVAGDGFHELCPIDWSPDGTVLLVEETTGKLESDSTGVEYWLFRRTAGFQAELVDLAPLTNAVKARWRAMGRAVADLEYTLRVHGWRGRGSTSLVVEVSGGFGSPPERMLPGYWLIEPGGSNPRWLAPSHRPPAMRRFGRVLGRQ